jgi:K+/H+ antiporter YhaU regulatory subunit KhtT
METFEFILNNVIIQNKTFNKIDNVSKNLQNININIEKESELLDNSLCNLENLRN